MNRTVQQPISPAKPVQGLVLQRKCACGGTPGPSGECEACRNKREAATLQRAASHSAVVNSVPPSVQSTLSSPGQPLDSATRSVMEPSFGHDFSGVRIHSGAAAAQSARDVNAHAYTVGQDIVFGAGRFAPNQHSGHSLLAHELTHTIQQRGMSASLATQSVEVAAGNSPLEREADAAAASVTGGGSAHVSAGTATAPKLQRQPTDAPVHGGTREENKALRDGVPYEKWSQQVEALYRKAGDPREFAIKRCREEGKAACAKLLTLSEVDALHNLASEAKGDEAKFRDGLKKIFPPVTLALLGPMPGGTALGGGAAVGGAVVAEGATATGAAAGGGATAGGGIAAVATVAGVAAIVAVGVLAGYQLWKLGQFQEALRTQGFTILEDPLRQAICHSCHTSPAPRTSDFSRTKPDFQELDPEMLKRFAEPQPSLPKPLPVEEKKPSPEQKPKPTTDVLPDPKPKEEEEERRPKDACQVLMGLRPGINARWRIQRPPIAGNTTIHAAAFRLDRGIPAPVGQDTTQASRDWSRAIGLPKDDAGHVIANRFGGRADFNAQNGNIFPQNLSFNRGTMRSYDAVVARLHQSGCDVCVNIGLMYAATTDLRPSSALYTFIYRPVGSTEFTPPISTLVPNP